MTWEEEHPDVAKHAKHAKRAKNEGGRSTWRLAVPSRCAVPGESKMVCARRV